MPIQRELGDRLAATRLDWIAVERSDVHGGSLPQASTTIEGNRDEAAGLK
jgi:hypothetical protein